MAKDDKQEPQKQVSINIDGVRTPILYSDSVFVGSNDFGVTLDFAQHLGPTEQQQVVARIGMSIEHAKKMIQVISEHLEKHER